MRNYIVISIGFALAMAISIAVGMRPTEHIAHIQTPDEKHIHQVYEKNPIKTEFVATAQGLSGVAIARKKSDTADQAITAHIYANNDIEIPSSLTISSTQLKLSFEPQAQSKYQTYTIIIDTPNLDKEHALFLPYESDATKYPNNSVWQHTTKKQGSLGITQYEKPTIALSLARWLGLPHQRTLWVGIGFCIFGITLRRTPSRSPLSKGEKLRYAISSPYTRGGEVGSWRAFTYYTIIFISILIVYWPATKLFFYSDDVPILARTEILKTTNPFLLFTPYQYVEADTQSNFGFDFWRPVSFAAYPLLLSYLPGTPNAHVYYFVNVVLFAITGCLLYTIAQYILKSPAFALIATAIWAFHSTKLGVLYWWSSSQDILASIFAMAAIVLHVNNKQRLALTCYMLGMLSKEYVIVTPLVIAGIELLHKNDSLHTIQKLTRYSITAGIFLVLNTIALGNPWTFKDTHANTYALSISPISIARNVTVYASASAEPRLWPTHKTTNAIEHILDSKLELWRAKTSGPYYPAIILISLWFICIAVFFKHSHIRNVLIFGGVWWILFLGPILLFANDWKPRWLTVSTVGIGLCAARGIQHIRLPKILAYGIAVLLLVYAFQTARSEHLTRFYREQSDYTRNALQQLQKQEKNVENPTRIILVGITEEQQTSLNAYLFRVYAKNPQADIIYKDSNGGLPHVAPSADGRSGDIIINMSGVIPYYPESEK